MKDEKILNIGDVIYSFYNKEYTGRYTIDRVTKTLAVSGNRRFHRMHSNYIKTVGQYAFSFTSYRLETPEIKAEYEKAITVGTLSKYDYNKLPIGLLKKIIKIFTP